MADARIGDTLYVYVEATSGDLRPELVLSNYADKPVVEANANGAEQSTTLTYTFDESASDFALTVTGCCQDRPTTGEYRLLIGTNAPDALTGEAEPNSDELLDEAG